MARRDRPVDAILSVAPGRRRLDRRQVSAAFDVAAAAHADQRRKDGTAYIWHPHAVACELAALGADTDVVCAGLLHDVVEDTDWTLGEIRDRFGPTVALLVDGVTKVEAAVDEHPESGAAQTVRKLIDAMAGDVRVLVVKLADRLHNMRTMGPIPQHKREKKARETLEVYAPLAARLGMFTFQQELEDRSFQLLYPSQYETVAALVDRRSTSVRRAAEHVERQLGTMLAHRRLRAEVSGRAKHLWSVWRKMVIRHVSVGEMDDLVAVRVLVRDDADCYRILQLVHDRWRPVDGKFKDYIARPKANGYQSLHTVVTADTPDGPMDVEVQIRTRAMHEVAEHGVAAHWRYKRAPDNVAGGDLSWLHRIVSLGTDVDDPAHYLDQLSAEIGSLDVLVSADEGQVLAVPRGTTAGDMAHGYRSPTSVADASSDYGGRPLKSGDTVPVGGPDRPGRWVVDVTAPDRTGLLRDITGTFASLGVDVVAATTSTTGGTATFTFEVSVGSVEPLWEAIRQLSTTPGIGEVRWGPPAAAEGSGPSAG